MDDEQKEPRYATFNEREERERRVADALRQANQKTHRNLVVKVLAALLGAALILVVVLAVLAGGDDDDDDEDDDSMGSQPVPALIA